MEPITIVLDGIEVSGRPGTTVLELAREAGVDIPTLCHDPHLSPLGACRVCLVEDEATGRLLASCVSPIEQGMVINTRSEHAISSRRSVIELMLASHPDSCIVCDKGNRCRLRKIAADLGVGLIPFEKIPTYHETVDLNPFIQRDLSKCIRCGRCIRADQEIAVVGAIDYTDRGFESRPATLHDAPLERTECNFCGICVTVCPTGALSERFRPSTMTADRATRTTCVLCGTGCAILLEHRGDRVLGASPAQDERSVNHVSLCVKGHYGMDFVNSRERLTTPLIHKNGELVPCSWDEALDFVVSGLQDLLNACGGAALGALGASRCTNEENYLLQKLARAAWGSNNIDNGGRLRSGSLTAGIEQVLGFGGMTNPISHLREADRILVFGADPLIDSPIAGQMIKQAVKFRGADLILIDPMPQGLAQFAGAWIRPRPGTHVMLLAGLVRAAMSQCPADHKPEPGLADWFERLGAMLQPYTLKSVEAATGVPANLLERAADRLSNAKGLAIVAGSGIARDRNSRLCGALLASLALLTDSVGRPGCGLFPLAASLNDQGAADMGASPDRLPGHQRLGDPEAMAVFERAWACTLPKEPGLDYISMIEAASRGGLAGLYVVGENPMGDGPDPEAARAALSNLDLLVVQDCFMTETAKLAHAVLPSASFAEKDGTWTSIERRVQRVRRAVSPIRESRPDWAIIAELIRRMGVHADYSNPDEVLREINSLVPIYRGATPGHLDLEDVFRPCFDVADTGTAILPTDKMSIDPVVPDLAAMDLAHPGNAGEPMAGASLFHSADGVLTAHSATLSKASMEARDERE